MRPVALLAVAGCLCAQSFWPGTKYDPGVPTFQKVLGYEPGERISSHANLVKYAEALAAALPGRVKLVEYARSWENRKLVYLVVGSEGNLRRLAEIQSGMHKLADPRVTKDDEARRLAASLPALVWLAAGVHGNEISSPEAVLLTAYHLLAARGDPMVDGILANTLVFLVPTQNPDGHERFVNHYEQSRGLEPDDYPLAVEHNEPFPSGRGNHYGFDMNRDWLALTQPEIRGQLRALRDWFPLVYVDLHEMGRDQTYFFAPEAVPYNPHLTKDQRESLFWFGKNNARWFDRYGFNYFTREIFDAFYPGYGASWPAYYGAIAMTYEQASARGLVVRRKDDTLLRFADGVRHHFVAALSTCETAANSRQKLLENFYRYRQTAIQEGQTEAVKEYVLVRQGDTSAVDRLAEILAEQGVEVRRALGAFACGNRQAPKGSYLVSLAQPSKRLVRTLLDSNVPMSDEFLKEQERRRKKKLPDEIYDVTGWSLPLMFNVELLSNAQPSQVESEAVKPGPGAGGQVLGAKTGVAYLVPWGTAAAGRFLSGALRQGIRLSTSNRAFTLSERKYPRGTLIVRLADNAADLPGRVAGLAKGSGADVYCTETSWVDEGVNFGSQEVHTFRRPVVGLLWDRPVAGTSAGFARFVLERQFDYPVTLLRASTLAHADLRRFNVLILPDGEAEEYGRALGPDGGRRLKDWVAAGGTLVSIGGANRYLADPKTGVLALAKENAAKEATPKKPEEEKAAGRIFASEQDYQKAIRAESESPDSAPGVLLRARTDPDHWMTAGAPESLNAVVGGSEIYSPIRLDKGVNAAVFAGPDQLLASGYLWEENRKQLAYKPLLAVQAEGRGAIVAFTADPNYRAYLNGMNVLFLNAVFRAPAVLAPGVDEDSRE